MQQQRLEKFADLILDTGIALQEGQSLQIDCEPVHLEAALTLERRAYEKGARFVLLKTEHARSKLHRANSRREQFLGHFPASQKAMVAEQIEDGWAKISLDGREEPNLLSALDQTRHAHNERALREINLPLHTAMFAGRNPWTIAALPTPGWAAQVLGGPADSQTRERMWDVLTPILRLDAEDPSRAWREHARELERRCMQLDEADLEWLHFTAPGTDLRIRLNPASRWVGGLCKRPNGGCYLPNIPTEEVFTTPDWRSTTGRASVTRPVSVLGGTVEGGWFEFRNGEVVDYGARAGKELLDAYFQLDPRGRFLGEVALVDVSSPIFRSGLVFHNILLDENAACHIALGRGISMAMENGAALNADELHEIGCNKALVHTDFMIGSEEMNLTGTTRTGGQVEILRAGRFRI